MSKRLLNVPEEKAPNEITFYGLPIYYSEYVYNNGFYFAHCETPMPNSTCFYLKKGCTGCLINKNTEKK